MKTCTNCGVEKPAEAFYPMRSGRLGRAGACAVCAAAIKRAARLADPEKARERERVRRQDPAYRADSARRAREWREKNPERFATVNKAAGRLWKERNPELVRLHAKRAYWKNRDKNIARVAQYRTAEREKINERARLRQKTERGRLKSKHHSAIRRARKRAVSVGPVDLEAIYARDGGRCWICWRSIPLALVHFDHVIPLAKGGEHTAENIRTCCQPCNDRKLHRLPTPAVIGAIREEVLALVA